MEQQRFTRKNPNVFDTQRRRRQKHTRRTVMIVLLFVAVSLIFVGVCFAVFLRVDTITVTGNTKYTEEEIVGLVPVEMGDNIFFFDADKTAEKIERTLPFVGEVTIKRDLPSTVAVEIIEEQPCFATGIAGDTYILSSDLKVLERRKRTSPEKTGLTVLQLNSVRRCIVGETIVFVDTRVADAISELYELFDENSIGHRIKSLDIRSRFDISFDYDDRFDVYFGDMQNADIKIRFLIGIIEKLGSDTKGTIDVSDHREASVMQYQ